MSGRLNIENAAIPMPSNKNKASTPKQTEFRIVGHSSDCESDNDIGHRDLASEEDLAQIKSGKSRVSRMDSVGDADVGDRKRTQNKESDLSFIEPVVPRARKSKSKADTDKSTRSRTVSFKSAPCPSQTDQLVHEPDNVESDSDDIMGDAVDIRKGYPEKGRDQTVSSSRAGISDILNRSNIPKVSQVKPALPDVQRRADMQIYEFKLGKRMFVCYREQDHDWTVNTLTKVKLNDIRKLGRVESINRPDQKLQSLMASLEKSRIVPSVSSRTITDDAMGARTLQLICYTDKAGNEVARPFFKTSLKGFGSLAVKSSQCTD